MSLPVDSDGFLRRACPNCEQNFKRLARDREHGDDFADTDRRYFCPYCGVQAPEGAWMTTAQVALAEKGVRRAVGRMLTGFAMDMEMLGHGAGDLSGAMTTYDDFDEPAPLTEADDMRRVDFECHSDESVKVSEDWQIHLYCPLCGGPAA